MSSWFDLPAMGLDVLFSVSRFPWTFGPESEGSFILGGRLTPQVICKPHVTAASESHMGGTARDLG